MSNKDISQWIDSHEGLYLWWKRSDLSKPLFIKEHKETLVICIQILRNKPIKGTSMVSIKGLSKAKVLAALYNNAKPMGMGFLRAVPGNMTEEQAEKHLKSGDDHERDFGMNTNKLYFDYLNGRCLKVDLSKDEFDPWGYDRDYGKGAAQKVIDSIK